MSLQRTTKPKVIMVKKAKSGKKPCNGQCGEHKKPCKFNHPHPGRCQCEDC